MIDAHARRDGMGAVYLAHDTRLGRHVALKLLPDYLTGDAERVRRFQREARAASALNHPNILTIYDFGQEAGQHYIATEFVEGQPLRTLIGSQELRLAEALDIAIQVASALNAAHEAGIIHRDIKPENLMLRPDGYVKGLDFGLAKLIEPEAAGAPRHEAATRASAGSGFETRTGVVLGTVSYMSPEQARGQKVDARTDMFSLGVVLYEMISGHRPFTGQTHNHVLVAILDGARAVRQRCCNRIERASAIRCSQFFAASRCWAVSSWRWLIGASQTSQLRRPSRGCAAGALPRRARCWVASSRQWSVRGLWREEGGWQNGHLGQTGGRRRRPVARAIRSGEYAVSGLC